MGSRLPRRQAPHAGVRRGPQPVRAHGPGRAHQDQERGGPHPDLPQVLQGGHLRIVRNEHWRGQHARLHQQGKYCSPSHVDFFALNFIFYF